MNLNILESFIVYEKPLDTNLHAIVSLCIWHYSSKYILIVTSLFCDMGK